MAALCALTFILAACGGGDPLTAQGGTAAGAASSTASPAGAGDADDARKGAAAVPAAAADGWTRCAGENEVCQVDGLRQLRYGAGTTFVTVEATGPVRCSNDRFGDPLVGVVKNCSVSAPLPWIDCAKEGDGCAFAGTRRVRYGTAEKYVVAEATNGTACVNAVFGDPMVGVVKRCWVAAPPAQTTQTASDCDADASLPTLPAKFKLVTSFCRNGRCAKPDDDIDDTDAIDEALDNAGGGFLVFPPGRYLISRSLRVKKPGVTLWGPGATLHATNWDDQSLIVEADDTSIYSFRFTAVTGERGSRAEHTRIAIYGPASVHPVVKNTVIRDNQIVEAGPPGSPLANAATGAGIFVNAADGFVISGNTVSRTLADGIHLTGGARNGRVTGNTVRETGDDMIAMVSYAYADPRTNPAWSIAASFANSLQSQRVRNVLVSGNRLSGQYWGRGIAVVGGSDITVSDNDLNNIPYAAAVLLARETQSGTYGLSNIVVEKNRITDVQTLAPPYDVGAKFASHARTGHGAVEVHASMFLDELGFGALTEGFAVSNLAIRDNQLTRSATPGVRIGVDTGGSWTFGARAVTGTAPMSGILVDRNVMSGLATGTPVQVLGGGVSCQGNVVDGRVSSTSQCTPTRAAASVATGASLACLKP